MVLGFWFRGDGRVGVRTATRSGDDTVPEDDKSDNAIGDYPEKLFQDRIKQRNIENN